MLDGHFTVFGYARHRQRSSSRSRTGRGVPGLRRREVLLHQEDRCFPGVRIRLLDCQLAVRYLLLPERCLGHVRPPRGLLRNEDGEADGILRDAVLAGASVAAALTTDYVNLVFIPILLGYLVFSFRGRRHLLASSPWSFCWPRPSESYSWASTTWLSSALRSTRPSRCTLTGDPVRGVLYAHLPGRLPQPPLPAEGAPRLLNLPAARGLRVR